MVYSEIYKILDCGTKKSVPKPNMPKAKDLHNLCWKRGQRTLSKKVWDGQNMTDQEYTNEEYQEPPPRIKYAMEKYREYYIEWDWINYPKGPQKMDQKFTCWATEEAIYDYLGWKPFEPWVMLNISPNWAGTKISRGNICKLKRTFESYMKEEWYSEWIYVLEAGGSGDHLHLHALCKMNKDKNIKSVRTHISKHWKRQVMKHAKNQGGGFGGLITTQGQQACVIQGEMGEQILKDKMDYLVEDKKPIGHKNKTPKTLEGVLGVLTRGSL